MIDNTLCLDNLDKKNVWQNRNDSLPALHKEIV